MIIFDKNQSETITNPILNMDFEFETAEDQQNDILIAQILKKELYLIEDLIILDKHDAVIDMQYIYYIKQLIATLNDEDDPFSIGYFLYDPEDLLLISLASLTKLYVLEVPSILWKYYIPDDDGFN